MTLIEIKTLKGKKISKSIQEKVKKKFFYKVQCCLHTCSAEEEQPWPAGNGKELAQMSNISAASWFPNSPSMEWHRRGRQREGKGLVMDTIMLKWAQSSLGSSRQRTWAWAEKENMFWLVARLQLSWPWAAHREGAGASPWLCDTGKAQLVGPRGVCCTESPTCCLCCPNNPQICALLPGDSSSASPQHQPQFRSDTAQPDSAQTPSELHTHPHSRWARGSCAQKQRQSTENWNNKCLQRAAHGQSSSYRLIKEKN